MPRFQPSNENLAMMRGFFVNGVTDSEIAQYFECTERTVQNWKRKFRQFPNNYFVDARKLNGSVTKLSNATIQDIDNIIQENPFTPCTKIKEQLQLDCHPETVRRTVKRSTMFQTGNKK